jgi:hypothetical protein
LVAEIFQVTANPESERRRSARVQLADTHGNLIVSLDGKVLDISVAGMAIETHSRLAPHHRISLRLRKGPELLQLQGRVVWCFLQGTRANDRGETVPVYRAGIEFTDVLSDLARDLLGFLETHAIVTLETRIFGRFRLEESSVSVSSSAEFEVRTINLHGMAVETTLAIDAPATCDVELLTEPRPIVCRARVVSDRPLPLGGDRYEVAVEFVDLPPEDRQLLREVIRNELDAGVGQPG